MVLYGLFAPDGRRALTTSNDKMARIWDTTTGQPLTSSLSHDGLVRHAEFEPDGELVLTTTQENSVRVWETSNGLLLTPPRQYPGWWLEAATDHEASASWNLPLDLRPVADLHALAGLLSGHQIDGFGGLVPLAPDELKQRWAKLRGR
jgi:WD40 repeat protein